MVRPDAAMFPVVAAAPKDLQEAAGREASATRRDAAIAPRLCGYSSIRAINL